jgi:putative redox protein
MNSTLTLDRNMRIIGTNADGLETVFDTHPDAGGEDTAPTPMEVLLQAMGACSFMDVVSILRKKRRQIDGLKVEQSAVRSEQHPKVLTEVHLKYILNSPDAEQTELDKAIELSQTKYCGASAMFQQSGCKVTWESEIMR